jgi:hypothetical protein
MAGIPGINIDPIISHFLDHFPALIAYFTRSPIAYFTRSSRVFQEMKALHDLDRWDLIATHMTFLPKENKIRDIFTKLSAIFGGKKHAKNVRECLSKVYKPFKSDHQLMSKFYEEAIEELLKIPFPKVKRFWKKSFGNAFDVSCGELEQPLYKKFYVALGISSIVKIFQAEGFVSQRQLQGKTYENIRVSRVALNQCWERIWRIYGPPMIVAHIEAKLELEADVASIRFGPASSISVKPFGQCNPRLYPVFVDLDTSHALHASLLASCLGLDVDFLPFFQGYWRSVSDSNSYDKFLNIAMDNCLMFFISPYFVVDRCAMTLWAIASVLNMRPIFLVIDRDVFDVCGAIEQLSKFIEAFGGGRKVFDAILDDQSDDSRSLLNTCKMFHSTLMNRFPIVESSTPDLMFSEAREIINSLGFPKQLNERISLEQLNQLELSISSGVNIALKVNLEWNLCDVGIAENLGLWILERSGSRCWVNYAK